MHFLLDGMLGKLTRWLRMMGCEATYMKNSSDRDLLTLAKRQSLILLTSDEELYRTATSKRIDAFLIQGRTEAERLAALAQRYHLNLQINPATSKCPICGSGLRQVPKIEVETRVPATTFKVYQSFWLCENPKCGKAYWHGSHWYRIEQMLESAKIILDAKRDANKEGKSGSIPESR